jgi:hypothetical protein
MSRARSWSVNVNVSRAYGLLRVTLGLNICLHGVVRWIKGLYSFAESLVPMFAKNPLPHGACMTSYTSFRSLKPLWVGQFCLDWRLDARC